MDAVSNSNWRQYVLSSHYFCCKRERERENRKEAVLAELAYLIKSDTSNCFNNWLSYSLFGFLFIITLQFSFDLTVTGRIKIN